MAKVQVEMEKGATIRRVRPSDLEVLFEQNGRRFVPKPSDKSIDSLMETLLLDGYQKQPCGAYVTKEGRLRLNWGYRRYLAVAKIIENGMVAEGDRLSRLEVVIVNDGKPMTDLEALLSNIGENIDRQELTVMDMASDAIRLRDEFGQSGKEIASRLRVTEGRVSQLVKLMALPMDVQKMLDKGDIAPATAYEMADMEPEELAVLVQAIKDGKKLTREAAREAKADKTRKKAAQDETGKTRAKVRSGKKIMSELEEYATPDEDAAEEPIHVMLKAVILYAMGKRQALWLKNVLMENAKKR
jgi:hypothetical protein